MSQRRAFSGMGSMKLYSDMTLLKLTSKGSWRTVHKPIGMQLGLSMAAVFPRFLWSLARGHVYCIGQCLWSATPPPTSSPTSNSNTSCYASSTRMPRLPSNPSPVILPSGLGGYPLELHPREESRTLIHGLHSGTFVTVNGVVSCN